MGASLSGVQLGCVHLFTYQGLGTGVVTVGLLKSVLGR